MDTGIFRRAFQGLEASTLEILREVAQRHAYPPDTLLCRQGKIEHTFYIIVEGRVAILQDLGDGTQRFMGLRGPGDYFGELSLLDDVPRIANCVTVSETSVLEVTQEAFGKVLKNSPAVAYALLRQIVRMLRENDKRALHELKEKNLELQHAYDDLLAAQNELVEKERLERELEIAANVQRSLLPARLPQYPDFHFAAHLDPAHYVGGDFYDVIHLDNEHVAFLLADVVDKSIHAALFMAVTRTLFRTESRRSLSPREVAISVHRGILDISEDAQVFVTAFYAVLHRPSRKLVYVIAGHERPLLACRGEAVRVVTGKGRFLGMINPLLLEEYELELNKGDRLLLFSDGVTDAANEDEQLYGHKRLMDVFSSVDDVAPDELLRIIAADVSAWSGTAPTVDDITMLVVEAKSTATA